MTTRFINHLLTGVHGARPAANAVPEGTLFACSTHNKIYQSDGASTWSDWAMTSGGAPSGNAGGDLTGTYPDPRVVGLNSIPIIGDPTVNQFLSFTGSAWRPVTLGGLPPSGLAGGDLTGTYPNPRVVGLNSIPILGAPSEGQVLMFTGSAWRPSTSAGGGGGGGDTILYDNTLGADGTWDVSNISQVYTHLRIVVHPRSDVANTQDYLKLTLNNDTTDANYRQADHYGGTAHSVTVANKRYIGFIPGSTSTAGIFNTLIINIPFYTNAHLKMVLSQGFQADNLTSVYVIQFGYIWNNTGAINRVALAPNTGTNLQAGSRLMIYGVL